MHKYWVVSTSLQILGDWQIFTNSGWLADLYWTPWSQGMSVKTQGLATCLMACPLWGCMMTRLRTEVPLQRGGQGDRASYRGKGMLFFFPGEAWREVYIVLLCWFRKWRYRTNNTILFFLFIFLLFPSLSVSPPFFLPACLPARPPFFLFNWIRMWYKSLGGSLGTVSVKK